MMALRAKSLMASILLLTAFAVLPVASGCKLLGEKTTKTEPTTVLPTSKGKVNLTEGTPTDQPATSAKATLAFKAVNTLANGATFKLFTEGGAVGQTGQIPTTLDADASVRYKIVVTKDGCQPWEAWQTMGAAGTATEVEVALQRLEAQMVNIAVCTVSGKRANQYCPTTVRRDLRVSEVPGYCAVHGPQRDQTVPVTLCATSKRRATRYCPNTVERRLAPGEVPGYCTIHTGERPQETVSVTLCTETQKRATQYCPSTTQRRLNPGEVPGYCTVHKAPRQETVSVTICTESKRRATQYCPSTTQRRFSPDEVPGYCRMHTRSDSGSSSASSSSGSSSSSSSGDSTQQAGKVCPQCGTVNRPKAGRCKNCRYHFGEG